MSAAIGRLICHRIAERSFAYGGITQSLLCARCSGLYIAFLVVAVLCTIRSRRDVRFSPSSTTRTLALSAILVMVVDVATCAWGLRTETIAVRACTGYLGGAGLAAILFPLVWSDRSGLVVGVFFARLIAVVAIVASVACLSAAVAGIRIGSATDLLAGAGVLAYMATMYRLSLRALQRLAARVRLKAVV